jgi:hypothetical protein
MCYPCFSCKKEIDCDAVLCGFCQKKTPVGRRKPILRIVIGGIFVLAMFNGVVEESKRRQDKDYMERLSIYHDGNVPAPESSGGSVLGLGIGVGLITWGWKRRKEYERQLAEIIRVKAGSGAG